jgi:hypothetical protein
VDLVRAVRVGAEKAIELNKDEDLGYHLLGRWHNEMVRTVTDVSLCISLHRVHNLNNQIISDL